MKTRYISGLIMLSAGAVVAVVGVICGTPTESFLKGLLLTLIGAFVFGLLVESFVRNALSPAPSRDEFEIFENIEEIIKREEEYDEKYNDGKKSHKEVTKLTLGD